MLILNIRVLHSQTHFLVNIFAYFETNTWSVCIVSRYYDDKKQHNLEFIFVLRASLFERKLYRTQLIW